MNTLKNIFNFFMKNSCILILAVIVGSTYVPQLTLLIIPVTIMFVVSKITGQATCGGACKQK